MSDLIKPSSASSLSAWLHYLENLHNKPIDLGLERVRSVAEKMDLVTPAPFVITVGGTNGKGTTCHTLEVILLQAGYRVGVYSSPHLLDYTERVRINGKNSEACWHVEAFDEIERCRQAISLTYFEFGTLSALHIFKAQKMDVVILEVGLGGRLDATNIIDSQVAVVTSIALDHTDWLGKDVESIGFEKAGILRSGCPAIVGEPVMPKSIADYAHKIGAALHCCLPNPQGDWSYTIEEASWSFTSLTRHYPRLPMPEVPLANAATALAALSYSGLDYSEKDIIEGLRAVSLAGRFQTIHSHPTIILDVAHNPHAAAYLAKKIEQRPKKGKLHVVIGMLADKDIAGTIAYLKPLVDYWYCASLHVPRGADVKLLQHHLPDDALAYDKVSDAWEAALSQSKSEDTIIVCGSFHTVAEVMMLVKRKDGQ